MLWNILQVLVCLLAAYGAVSLAAGLPRHLLASGRRVCGNIKLVLLVQNQEHVIEGIVRSIFAGGLMDKALCNAKLIVVDMSSTDETPEILERLRNYYGSMDFMKAEKKDCIFDGFDQ
jgi:hypothetical protein